MRDQAADVCRQCLGEQRRNELPEAFSAALLSLAQLPQDGVVDIEGHSHDALMLVIRA
jgi:hypothetical protein